MDAGFIRMMALQEELRMNDICDRIECGESITDMIHDQIVDKYEAAEMGLITYEEADAMMDV